MNESIRVGVVGLGNMGRHHARLAARMEGVTLVGGADPAGDQFRSLGGFRLFPSIEDILDMGIDAAILATPPSEHEKGADILSSAGVHTLIEKPLGLDLPTAEAIRGSFEATDLVAGVGHVERFNPALQEMKRRLDDACLGQVFSISTRRTGPYPIQRHGVGVIHDLATHDIDIIHWLAGDYETLTALVANQLGSSTEDLVEAVGRLVDGTVVSMSVNWLTPAKERKVTVLGERGALVADLLASDLTFYSNAAIPVEWDEMARLKGVSEGDMTRYAIRKVEPLQLELEGFRDAILGNGTAQVVSLQEGVEVIRVADAMLSGGL